MQLTTEQRSRVTTVIKQENNRPEANVNFALSVETVVPRTIHMHLIPQEIVEIRPQWRPYEFILLGNDIVVVDPHNLEIVAVLPA